MKKTILIILLALLCIFFSTTGQHTGIIGRVTVQNSKDPLRGATIKIEGSSESVQTDADGNFNISTAIPEGFLLISFTGYKTLRIPFDPKNKVIQASLQEENSELSEIVIIGYGKTTKKLNTGSVSSISAKEIEQQPVTNVLSALSGRMPGVFVQTSNGLPGGNINVQIRGKGSIQAGTNPLYIVDGVPFDGTSINSGSALSINNIAGNTSPLNSLNPADIASIVVLKDADATSIYGSRGSNGVVLITTKNALPGKTTLNLNLTQGLSTTANQPRILNLQDYLQLRREAFKNDGLIPSNDPLSPNYAPDLTIWSQDQATDWAKYIFGNTAGSTDVQAKISGGKAGTNFMINTNYHHETTILPGKTNFERGGLLAQIRHRSEDNKFGLTIINTINRQHTDLTNPIGNINRSILLAPNYPLYEPNGDPNWYAGTNINQELNSKSKAKTNTNNTSLALDYSLTSDLKLLLNAGYNRISYDQTQIFPSSSLIPGAINYTNFGTNISQSFIAEPQINYTIKLRNSTLAFLAGATYQNKTSQTQFIKASNFGLAGVMENLSSAATIDTRQNTQSQYKYSSIFSRVTYNLKDRYLINATIRRDGSSRFGPGNRFGNFGSVGLAWIFSEEPFFKVPVISYGKMRASFGTTGNDQISDYQYLSTYSSPGSNIYQNMSTLRPSRIYNAEFHWETTFKMDIALDLGLFKDRILVNANYYKNRSKDQLVAYSLPQITGFANYQANLPAVIENSGWEFQFTGKILQHKELTWTANFNLSIPRNTLKSFKDFESSSYKNEYELGFDISRIYGYKFLGVNEQSGKAEYAGENGEVSSNPYPFFTLGKTTPDYYGGLGTSVTYRQFGVEVFSQFSDQVSRGGLQYYPGVFVLNNYSMMANRWTPEQPNTHVPKATTNFDAYYDVSSANVFRTTYLRIKNISLSYTFKPTALAKYKISGIKLFAQAQNLFTFWNRDIPVADPESGPISGTSKNIPPLKSMVLGLHLTL